MSLLIFYKLRILLAICLIFKFDSGRADDKEAVQFREYYDTLIKTGALEVNPLLRFVATIRRKDYDSGYAENYICAGAIITPSVILSTAHCLTNDNSTEIDKNEIIVVGGSPTGSMYHEKAQVRSVDYIIRHEKFTLQNYAHDVALILLSASFHVDLKYMDIIAITSFDPGPHETCTFIGLGAMDYNEETLFEALEETLLTWPYDLCKVYLEKYGTDESDKICAGDRRSFSKSPCPTLASEPLLCNEILYGLSVYDIGCEVTTGFAASYVNMHSYRNWISGKGINFLSSKSSHYCGSPFLLFNCIKICKLVAFIVVALNFIY